MRELKLSLQMLGRDLRAGELGLLVLALWLAVTALTSVGFITDRVEAALRRDANQLLGGDLLVSADHPLAPDFAAQAAALGVRSTRTTTFNSMLSSADAAQLAAVKAVSPAYPMRGSVQIALAVGGKAAEAGRIPAPGEVWLDEQLLAAMHLAIGDSVELGLLKLRVGAIVTFESDRGMGFSSFAPRAMINEADLAASGLMQEGSRARYRMQFAGAAPAVATLQRWVSGQLQRGEQMESLDNARPEIRSGLDRASRFLRLAAMLSVVLAAVAIGLSSRRYLQRHLDGCAVMRCFGAQRSQLLKLYLIEFLLVGLGGAALGCATGYAVQLGLVSLARELLLGDLPAPGALPVLHGMLVGVVLMLGFVAPQLLRLTAVPPIRVIRREWAGAGVSSQGAWALGIALLAGLMGWIAGEIKLAAWVLGGLAGATLVFVAVAWLALAALARLRGLGSNWGLRYGLAALHRRRSSSVVQIVALSIGLTAMILLSLVSRDLVSGWRGSVAPGAPNRFVINIQPGQVKSVTAWLDSHHLQAALLPMVRGRMVTINGKPVVPAQYADERARNLMEREFNLSWSGELPKDNTVVAGRWQAQAAPPVFSMEQGLGRTLGLALGDEVGFDVAGQRVTAKVGSVRKLDWNSMRVNFFFIASPGLLEGMPASYITSFNLAPNQTGLVRELVAAYPNLTVIDVSAVMAQFEEVSEKLVRVVNFVFVFALLAGLIVLLAAQRNTHDERGYEISVLRALGARHHQVRLALLAEFAALGVVASCLAVLASVSIGYGLAHYVFEMAYSPGWLALLGTVVAACGCIVGFGWLGVRAVLTTTVMQGLRANA